MKELEWYRKLNRPEKLRQKDMIEMHMTQGLTWQEALRLEHYFWRDEHG